MKCDYVPGAIRQQSPFWIPDCPDDFVEVRQRRRPPTPPSPHILVTIFLWGRRFQVRIHSQEKHSINSYL